MNDKRIYIYAFDTDTYRVVDTHFLKNEFITISNLKNVAKEMKEKFDFHIKICAIDNYYGLYSDFMKSIKSKIFEDQYEFYDLVVSKGIIL